MNLPSAAAAPGTREREPLRHAAVRAGLIAVLAAALGLGANALSLRPVPLLDAQGPGALPPDAPRITPEACAELLAQGRALLLDARSDLLRARGLPAGALRVTPEILEARYAELQAFFDAGKDLVVICDTGACTGGDLLVARLAAYGHAGARVLEGGWPAYVKAGLPVEAPAP